MAYPEDVTFEGHVITNNLGATIPYQNVCRTLIRVSIQIERLSNFSKVTDDNRFQQTSYRKSGANVWNGDVITSLLHRFPSETTFGSFL